MTYNKDGTPRKAGSGRTPGANSFVILTLKQLVAKFADENQPIVIGRKWAEGVGFNGTSVDSKNTTARIEGQTPETRVQMSVMDLVNE